MSEEGTPVATAAPAAVPVAPEVAPPVVPTTPASPAASNVEEYGKYEAAREERRLKHWVIKVIVFTVAAMFAVVCSSIIYVNVVKGPTNGADASVIKTFLDTLLEMLKLMKNTS